MYYNFKKLVFTYSLLDYRNRLSVRSERFSSLGGDEFTHISSCTNTNRRYRKKVLSSYPLIEPVQGIKR